jgi:hypothetical protein
MLDLLFRLVALIATVKPTFSSFVFFFLKTKLSLSLSRSLRPAKKLGTTGFGRPAGSG